MATFLLPRWLNQHDAHIQAARRLAHILGEADSTVSHAKASSHAYTAADSLTLRGIPAVGLGVHGHIAGTQPENRVCR